ETRRRRARLDRGLERAEVADRAALDVARLEVHTGCVAGPIERAAGDDVAGLPGHELGSEGDDLREVEDHVPGVALLPDLVADLELHVEVARVRDFVGGGDPRAPRGEAVDPLAVQPVEEGVEATRLATLDVPVHGPARDVVDDGVA